MRGGGDVTTAQRQGNLSRSSAVTEKLPGIEAEEFCSMLIGEAGRGGNPNERQKKTDREKPREREKETGKKS